MGKAGFIWRSIRRVNYGQMLRLCRQVAKRSKKNFFTVLIDMAKSAVKFEAAPFDYFNFRFERLNDAERDSFVTRGINAKLNSQLNSEEGRTFFADKENIYKILDWRLGRAYMVLKGDNAAAFAAFCADKTSIMVKPIDGNGGFDVEKINLDAATNLPELYERLWQRRQVLVEDYIIQAEAMCRLNRASVNTLRVVTLRDPQGNAHVAATVLRMGGGTSPLDNFHAMGLAAVVDADGIVRKPAINKDNEIFTVHPISHTPIIGFQVAGYDAAVQFVLNASELVPYMGYLGWDIAFSEKGPLIIEANMYPSYDLIQTAMIADGSKRGIRECYESIAFKGIAPAA